MLIRKIFSYVILVSLLGSIVYVWQSVPLPCETPLHYSLGTFDTRFAIDEEGFLKEVAFAESVWEKALGKELFTYAPESAFKVHLVYDERQKRTQESQTLEAERTKTEGLQENLNQKQEATLARFNKERDEYEDMVASFKKRLNAYNAEVEKWNKQGGAPPEEYENLQKVAKALAKDQEKLEEKRQDVNKLAADVNAFSKQKVAVAEKFNAQVEDYVTRYGEGKEFDQGVYAGTEINIYQYDDMPHLRAVLVHELGHALGLGHALDPQSIMYHLMGEQKLEPLSLSEEDKKMLVAQCNQTVRDILLQRIDLLKQSRV